MPKFQTKALAVPPVGGNNFGVIPLNCMVGLASGMFQQKLSFLFYKERLLSGDPLNAYHTKVCFVRYIRVHSLCKGWSKQSRSFAPSVHNS